MAPAAAAALSLTESPTGRLAATAWPIGEPIEREKPIFAPGAAGIEARGDAVRLLRSLSLVVRARWFGKCVFARHAFDLRKRLRVGLEIFADAGIGRRLAFSRIVGTRYWWTPGIFSGTDCFACAMVAERNELGER